MTDPAMFPKREGYQIPSAPPVGSPNVVRPAAGPAPAEKSAGVRALDVSLRENGLDLVERRPTHRGDMPAGTTMTRVIATIPDAMAGQVMQELAALDGSHRQEFLSGLLLGLQCARH